MTEARVIAHFRRGDEVPDWLLHADPEVPGSVAASIHYQADGCLLETPVGIWVVLFQFGLPSTLYTKTNGKGTYQIWAAGRRVILPQQFEVHNGPDDPWFGEGGWDRDPDPEPSNPNVPSAGGRKRRDRQLIAVIEQTE